MAEWENWKHITKLDPDRKISDRIIKTIVDSGTDAIMISGSQRITKEKVKKLLELLKPYSIPKVLEPVDPRAVVYSDVDYIFVPSVFNTKNYMWINGFHELWVKIDKNINWDIVVPEAYIILNPKCGAARKTKAFRMKKEDVIAAAVCAEQYFKFPVIYIEYSGVYGDPELTAAVKASLKKAHLFYGGGIDSAQKAEEMSRYATIVVGNTLYENGTRSLLQTVKGSLRAFSKKIHLPKIEKKDFQIKFSRLRRKKRQ